MRDFPAALERWEKEMREYERATGTPLADLTKLSSLRQLIPDSLEKALSLQPGSMTYVTAKEYVTGCSIA